MSDTPSGLAPGLLPIVLMTSALALAEPAAAAVPATLPATDARPAAMHSLPQDFRLPERLAAYEKAKAEETQVAMRFLDWLFGDEPVNRCGTTSGCRSGWDDSDCF